MHFPGLALYNFKRSQTASEVIQQIRAQGGAVEALETDLTDPRTIPLLFDRAEATFGAVALMLAEFARRRIEQRLNLEIPLGHVGQPEIVLRPSIGVQ